MGLLAAKLNSDEPFFPQTLQVDDLIVRGAGLPAFPDDANPLKGQRSHRRVMTLPFAALQPIIGSGPERVTMDSAAYS